MQDPFAHSGGGGQRSLRSGLGIGSTPGQQEGAPAPSAYSAPEVGFDDPFSAGGSSGKPTHGGGAAPPGGAAWFTDSSADVPSSHGSAPQGGSMQGFGGGGGHGGALPAGGPPADDLDLASEPPLLEELGINFEHILGKTYAVLVPNRQLQLDPAAMEDADFAGPLVFCLLLGFAMLLAGKIHFGVIYGVGACGCLAMYLVLNLMADASSAVDIYQVFSIHGYCLLPIVLLAVVNVFVTLNNWFGTILAIGVICWCTYPCTVFFEQALKMSNHRWLIAYPVFMLYASFAIITIF